MATIETITPPPTVHPIGTPIYHELSNRYGFILSYSEKLRKYRIKYIGNNTTHLVYVSELTILHTSTYEA